MRSLTIFLAIIILYKLQLQGFAQTPTNTIRSLPPSADEHPQHLACHDYLSVEENFSPAGEPGMSPCATGDDELEDFYKKTMEPDLEYWKQRSPLNWTHIHAFLDRWKNYGWHQQSMILIYKNRWYYPFHSAWNHTQKSNDKAEAGITLWVGASQYYFLKAVKEMGMDFPDVFFFQSDQDYGWCGVGGDACPIPALSIAKDIKSHTTDLLYPFMVGCEHPLYNFPHQLKHNKAFFSGRPNWGGSPRIFNISGTEQRFWSRQHMANLSLSHPEKVMASLIANPTIFPGVRISTGEVQLRDHAR